MDFKIVSSLDISSNFFNSWTGAENVGEKDSRKERGRARTTIMVHCIGAKCHLSVWGNEPRRLLAARLRTFYQWISSRSAILSISFECGQPNASGTLNPPMRLSSSLEMTPHSQMHLRPSYSQAFRDTFLKRSVNETRKTFLNLEILTVEK